MLTNEEIQNVIPHRYPFLLVDKVLDVEPGKKIVAIKNVTANEPFFQGHFPGYPVMPGVLIVEALAQTAGIAVNIGEDKNAGKLGMFASIDEMKIKNPVFPGDTLQLEAEILSNRMGIVKAKVLATVGDKTAAEGEIRFAMVDVKK